MLPPHDKSAWPTARANEPCPSMLPLEWRADSADARILAAEGWLRGGRNDERAGGGGRERMRKSERDYPDIHRTAILHTPLSVLYSTLLHYAGTAYKRRVIPSPSRRRFLYPEPRASPGRANHRSCTSVRLCWSCSACVRVCFVCVCVCMTAINTEEERLG